MNKNIKLLLESLFDDEFDDLYNDDALDKTSEQIANATKITSLGQCDNQEEVDEYFINKYDLNNQVINTVISVMDEIDKCTDNGFFWSSRFDSNKLSDEHRMVMPRSNSFINPTTRKYEEVYNFDCYIGSKESKDFKFTIKQEPYSITYRNKEKVVKSWTVVFNGKEENYKIIWKLINYPSILIRRPGDKDKNAPINKVIDKINQEQFSDVAKKTNEIDTALKEQVESVFKTKRLADELTCTGKVYKVTQKDIDRMQKCLLTGKYNGFDKITKSDKMVARMAALFICAKNMGYKDMQLSFNDDILISAITGARSYRTSRSMYMNKRQDYINVLKKLQVFPDIHLKDVIATYNAYKDQF